MKRTIICLLAMLSILTFSGCGEDPKTSKFENDVNSFCDEVKRLDDAINSIDGTSENATRELLGYLDQLDQCFKVFAEIDAPEEFDYIEPLADEASSYMTTAVSSYHEAYSNNGYNEYTESYARENYERACKRMNIILQFIQGKEITDYNVHIETVE